MAIKVTHIKPEYVDKRGGIARVLDLEGKKLKLNAILRISHKKGTPPRGNHYHKKDYHWVYVESGKIKYSEKPSNKPRAKVTSVVMKKGDLVLSTPGVIHAMEAVEDAVFWAFTTEKRDQKSYEKDTVRIQIV
jgi:quercetin dioxygenase-like cupin family protein